LNPSKHSHLPLFWHWPEEDPPHLLGHSTLQSSPAKPARQWHLPQPPLLPPMNVSSVDRQWPLPLQWFLHLTTTVVDSAVKRSICEQSLPR